LAADSISANIAEGFGRYHKNDKIRFYRYSQASLNEWDDWNAKSKSRALITDDDFVYILKQLQGIEKSIYRLIRFTNEKLKF